MAPESAAAAAGAAPPRLLGKSSSINVRKVLWLCDELGLAIAHEEWGSGTPRSTQDPAYLALNPNGLVPVLVDGDAVLWESNTICRYLAARSGRDDLLPQEPLARARVEQWMDWQATDLNSAWRPVFMGRVRGSPQHQDPAAQQASIDSWNRLMGILDAQLARTQAFAAGPAFTLADIVLGLATNRWRLVPMERPSLPHVDAWFARLAARPGFQHHGCNGTP